MKPVFVFARLLLLPVSLSQKRLLVRGKMTFEEGCISCCDVFLSKKKITSKVGLTSTLVFTAKAKQPNNNKEKK